MERQASLKYKNVERSALIRLRFLNAATGLSANALALALRVPGNRITYILNRQRGITADTALRLGRYFGTSAQMWMNLQSTYELEAAEDTLLQEVMPRPAA